MPNISLRAIRNNRNLHGSEINLRDAIASFCSWLNPTTGRSLTEIGEVVGMGISQASKVLTKLIEKKEVANENGRFYLLSLDDPQIKGIYEKDKELLAKLAALGCEEAAEFLDKEASLNSLTASGINFLFYFFLFSQFPSRNLNLSGRQDGLDGKESLNSSVTSPYKEAIGVMDLKNGVIGEEEEEEVDSVTCKGDETKTAAASAAANADSDILQSEDTDESVAIKLNSGKSDKEIRKIWVEKHKRKDMDTDAWRGYLQKLPECRHITVQSEWTKMLKWCSDNNKQASRGRFLNWLRDEIEDVPEEINVEGLAENDKLQPNDGKDVTEKRRSAAKNRIEFGKFAKDKLESEGIVQVGDL